MICPHCNRTIREEQRYLMSLDPDRPGLFESLRGEGGEGWRLFVTTAMCVLGTLVLTAIMVAAR